MKTVAGQQLLKDKIAVTLPIKMTPDEVKKLSADTSKGEYNDAENMFYMFLGILFVFGKIRSFLGKFFRFWDV